MLCRRRAKATGLAVFSPVRRLPKPTPPCQLEALSSNHTPLPSATTTPHTTQDAEEVRIPTNQMPLNPLLMVVRPTAASAGLCALRRSSARPSRQSLSCRPHRSASPAPARRRMARFTRSSAPSSTVCCSPPNGLRSQLHAGAGWLGETPR